MLCRQSCTSCFRWDNLWCHLHCGLHALPTKLYELFQMGQLMVSSTLRSACSADKVVRVVSDGTTYGVIYTAVCMLCRQSCASCFRWDNLWCHLHCGSHALPTKLRELFQMGQLMVSSTLRFACSADKVA